MIFDPKIKDNPRIGREPLPYKSGEDYQIMFNIYGLRDVEGFKKSIIRIVNKFGIDSSSIVINKIPV